MNNQEQLPTTATVTACFIMNKIEGNEKVVENILQLSPFCPLLDAQRLLIENKSNWVLSTPDELSYDISDQLHRIVRVLDEKKEELHRIKAEVGASFIFKITIFVQEEDKNMNKPAIHVDSEVVSFIEALSAELIIDLKIV